MSKLQEIIEASERIRQDSEFLISQIGDVAYSAANGASVPFVMAFTTFVLACFVGYFVVWRVTPALHTPLMAVTNAISSVIIVGAIIALGSAKGFTVISVVSFFAIVIASVNIFGGFFVTYRMLEMFKR